MGEGVFQNRMNLKKFSSKVNTMMTDLNQTVAGEANRNSKLEHNVTQLRRALDMEKKRTMDLDRRLRDEFKEYKQTENEKLDSHERLNHRLHDIRIEIGIEIWV